MTPMADIFIQGLLARLIPWCHEVLLYAHALMGTPHVEVLAFIGSLGAMLGYAPLYATGHLLRRLLTRVSSKAQQQRSLRLEPLAKRYLPVLLLLAPVHFLGLFLLLAAGFYRVSAVRCTLALCAAELLLRLSMLSA